MGADAATNQIRWPFGKVFYEDAGSGDVAVRFKLQLAEINHQTD